MGEQTAQKGIRYGGREKGTPNKTNALALDPVQRIIQSGRSPVVFLLDLAESDQYPIELRVDAAKAAAPYVHPRLQAINHSGSVEQNHVFDKENHLEVARRVAFLLRGANPDSRPATLEHQAKPTEPTEPITPAADDQEDADDWWT